MSHILRIMASESVRNLEKVAEHYDSLLVRTALGLQAGGLEKRADGGGGSSGLHFPDNPVLVSLRQQMAEVNLPDAPELQQLLLRVLTLDLQNMMAKFERDKVLNPLEMEANRIEAMADVLRARVDALRKMKEMRELQMEMASEMGLMQNPAVAAAGQMPTPIAQQPPEAMPPEAQGMPPQAVPEAAPPEGAVPPEAGGVPAPVTAPGAGPAGAM